MSGARHRRKGNRIERELVAAHKALGIHCERVPLSGGAYYRGRNNDVDLYLNGADKPPLTGEVKARRDGQGFAVLEGWLGDCDLLFLRRDGADPLVVLPWRVWASLLKVPG